MLGKCNRVCIPLCVVHFIRSIRPSKDGTYTGHQSAEGGNEVDHDGLELEEYVHQNNFCSNALNTSDKEIEVEASPKLVNFDAGKKRNCCSISATVISVLSMSVGMS